MVPQMGHPDKDDNRGVWSLPVGIGDNEFLAAVVQGRTEGAFRPADLRFDLPDFCLILAPFLRDRPLELALDNKALHERSS